MTKKSIEDLFKDSFENFEVEVNPSVWENIKTGLKGVGLGLLGKTLINKIGANTLVAVVSSAITVVATVTVMNWTAKVTKKANFEKSKPTEVNLPVVNKMPTPGAEVKIEPSKIEKPVIETNISKSDDRVAASDEQTLRETKIVIAPFHKDKKKIQSIINTFTEVPVASIFASPIGGTVPLIVNLSNSGNGKINKWKYSDGNKEDRIANPVHVFETPGIYTVTLTSTDAEGKTQTDSLKIDVMGNSSMAVIPRELTPNGDGVNDVFYFNGKNIVKMSGQIFDRKGKIYFECDRVGAKWDGKTRSGEEAKEGLYFYIETAEGVDGKFYEQKGSINLRR